METTINDQFWIHSYVVLIRIEIAQTHKMSVESTIVLTLQGTNYIELLDGFIEALPGDLHHDVVALISEFRQIKGVDWKTDAFEQLVHSEKTSSPE